MRILSISGQNIASLAAKFHIDFTIPPLATAGLFAITGETGAGKSSILDAMCLALYGDAPRLSGGSSRDEVPDPSGNAIKAGDARSILRRGAAQAWAEVHFTAKDGQDYSVKWAARRARDKADGSLQNVSRSLIRLSDQTVLASQIKQVDEKVQDLTGFSYPEFRRTVLLAQGDFDAFLRADTNERAALLEKVTGSDLYRAISKRIYERNEAAKQAKDLLCQRVGEHDLLTDEARAAYIHEKQVKTVEAEGFVDAIKAVQAKLGLHKAHRDALKNYDSAKAALLALQAQEAEAALDRSQLALIEKAKPLQKPWQELQEAEAAVIKSNSIAAEKLSAKETARLIAEQQREKALTAEQNHRAHEDEFKRLGPVWSAASDLDSRIDVAQKEVKEAQTLQADGAKALKDRASFLVEITQSLAEIEEERKATDGALSARAEDLPLAAKWDQIASVFKDVLEGEAHLEQNMLALQSLSKEKAQFAVSIAKIAHQLNQADLKEADQRQEALDLQRKLSQLLQEHPQERALRLAELSSLLERMSAIQKDFLETSSKGEDLRGQIQQVAKEKTQAEQDAQHAKGVLQAAQQLIASLQPHWQRAELAASDIAKSLRLGLEKGCPCPVCGATEHPAAADKALISIAEELKADLKAASNSAETAQTQWTSVLQVAERAFATLEQLTLSAKAMDGRLAQLLSHWQDLRAEALLFELCPPLPEHPYDAILPSLAVAQEDEAKAQAQITSLRAELQRLLQESDQAQGARRKLLQERENLLQDQNRLAHQETQISAHNDAAKAMIAKHQSLISPWHKGDRLNLSIVEALKARVDAILNLQARCVRLEEKKRDLLPKLAEQNARHEEARLRLAEVEKRHATRQAILQKISHERAKLLGGMPTSEHRSNFNLARQAAQSAYENEAKALSQANSEEASALAFWRSAAENAEQTAKNLRQKTAIFDEAKANSGIDEAKITELLAKPASEVLTLREKLATLDASLLKAQSDLSLRKLDLAQLIAPVQEEGVLIAQLDALQLKEADLHQRQGVISEILAQDAEKQRKIEGLQQEIAQAQAEADIWSAVNRAAGSRNGDSFVKVAQSLTLDVLIAHANHHLADLAPRYRLRRGMDLALQIEDRDLGGEPRATRSLSGGERFLVSLALALALSRLGGKGGLAGTLFIDEGFGSLDPTSLNQAIEALETLQSQGRQVGVISHVEAMKERIATRILVKKMGSGRSEIEIS